MHCCGIPGLRGHITHNKIEPFADEKQEQNLGPLCSSHPGLMLLGAPRHLLPGWWDEALQSSLWGWDAVVCSQRGGAQPCSPVLGLSHSRRMEEPRPGGGAGT